jgi:hypothetical protein
MLVTSKGKPELIVTKALPRPRKTAAQWQAEARKLLDPDRPTKKVNTLALLRELRS